MVMVGDDEDGGGFKDGAAHRLVDLDGIGELAVGLEVPRLVRRVLQDHVRLGVLGEGVSLRLQRSTSITPSTSITW